MADPPKMRWADIADEEDLKSLEIPVVISKHGIKIAKKPSYVPPHQRPDKNHVPSQKRVDGS
jgi:hypothetical protein